MKNDKNILRSKSYSFALRVVKLYKYLCGEKKEFVLSKQILRCGTSIGASVRESEYAQSKADFVHKLSISLKEANETEYWLSILKDCDYIEEKLHISLNNDCLELIRILIASIKTVKNSDRST